MRSITLDVHGVTRIEAETTRIGEGPAAFNVTRLRFFDKDDSETVVTAFTGRDVVGIDGSDHVNHVASAQEPMEVAA